VFKRSNDINCRVVDKWLWGVIKEANVRRAKVAPAPAPVQEQVQGQVDQRQQQQQPTLQGPQGPPVTQFMVLTVTCPADGGPGTTLVQQSPFGLFSVVVPAGIAPGGSFPVTVPVPVVMVVAPVPATTPAAAAVE
jgi:hypothetical protein